MTMALVDIRDLGVGLHFERPHGRQAPAACIEDALKLIAHDAKQIRRALRVIGRGMCRRRIPLKTCSQGGAHQHGLAECDAAQGGGIET